MLKKINNNHSVSILGYHFVWCTKYRHTVLKEYAEIVCKESLAQTCIEYGWTLQALEIMPDHVHIFLQAHHTDSPESIVRTLKSISAVAVFTSCPALKGQKFWGSGLWSKGTYYASVGVCSQETIQKYINEQKIK